MWAYNDERARLIDKAKSEQIKRLQENVDNLLAENARLRGENAALIDEINELRFAFESYRGGDDW